MKTKSKITMLLATLGWLHMLLRLHPSGLEGLTVSHSRIKLTAEAAGPDNKKFLHITKNADQSREPATTKLTECEIRAFGNDGRPSKVLPLKDGSFKVHLPKELFADNPESITINWIDFYR